jgi:malate dehydrogenase (oxaloacetate-decarboxylating)(NADP+)
LEFGKDYIIPKPLDLRLIEFEAAAVAEAAMKTGVARRTLNLEQYKLDLRKRLADSSRRISAFVDTYHLDF